MKNVLLISLPAADLFCQINAAFLLILAIFLGAKDAFQSS